MTGRFVLVALARPRAPWLDRVVQLANSGAMAAEVHQSVGLVDLLAQVGPSRRVSAVLLDGGAHGVSAALEFAVQVLHVKHIVVLGHAQCGGVRAFIDKIAPLSPGDFIGRWMSLFVKPGEIVEQREHESIQQFVTRIEKAAVLRSIENLMTFPCVSILVGRGKLQLHGAYFGVAEGSLSVLDEDAKEFRRVTDGALVT